MAPRSIWEVELPSTGLGCRQVCADVELPLSGDYSYGTSGGRDG